MPILFVFQNSEDDAVMRANLIVGIIGYFLLIVIVLVIKIVDEKLKKQMLSRRPWIDLLNKFSADTSVFTYLLTSLGYILIMMDHFAFWFIYGTIFFVFIVAMYYDVIKPLLKLVLSKKK